MFGKKIPIQMHLDKPNKNDTGLSLMTNCYHRMANT